VFQSNQSTSCSTKQALVGKKTQSATLKRPSGREKTGNYILVEAHRTQIESGELVVLFVDECHLLWGGI